MLEIKGLCYQVEGERDSELDILRDIDLTVEDNKFVVITGPNGGGKTTLAKAIMGLVQPTSGTITWNGTDITHMKITERAKLGVSYGFQQPPRFKGLRVKDLLALAAGSDKLTHEEGCQYLTRVGLCANDYLDREVDASLSGGEVKRIEIATILARKAGLMIFDEPEAGIDLWSFARLTETFKAIHEKREARFSSSPIRSGSSIWPTRSLWSRGARWKSTGPRTKSFPRSWPTPSLGAAI